LGGHIRHDIRRYVGRFGQEGAEKTNGRQLNSEAQLVVCTTPLVDPFAVGVIQVEVA
jgi:hypothetical protein